MLCPSGDQVASIAVRSPTLRATASERCTTQSGASAWIVFEAPTRICDWSGEISKREMYLTSPKFAGTRTTSPPPTEVWLITQPPDGVSTKYTLDPSLTCAGGPQLLTHFARPSF